MCVVGGIAFCCFLGFAFWLSILDVLLVIVLVFFAGFEVCGIWTLRVVSFVCLICGLFVSWFDVVIWCCGLVTWVWWCAGE